MFGTYLSSSVAWPQLVENLKTSRTFYIIRIWKSYAYQVRLRSGVLFNSCVVFLFGFVGSSVFVFVLNNRYFPRKESAHQVLCLWEEASASTKILCGILGETHLRFIFHGTHTDGQ